MPCQQLKVAFLLACVNTYKGRHCRRDAFAKGLGNTALEFVWKMTLSFLKTDEVFAV